jgi:hypothetical protein
MISVLTAALLLTCANDRLPPAGAVREVRTLDRLQGVWVRVQRANAARPLQLDDSGVRLTFHKDRWILHLRAWVLEEGSLTLSEERRRVKLAYDGEHGALFDGTFALQGNMLRFRTESGIIELFEREP